MLKKIEPRIVVPLVLGMMFALGDEASNREGAAFLCAFLCIFSLR